MIGLNLDPQGRLLQLDAVPPQVEKILPAPAPFDWKALFTAAGLDMTRFTSVEPQWISLAPFDARAAWRGSYASAPEIPMRIEAASWRGKPVFFRVIGPWSKPERISRPRPVSIRRAGVCYHCCLCWVLFSRGSTSGRKRRRARSEPGGRFRLRRRVAGPPVERPPCCLAGRVECTFFCHVGRRNPRRGRMGDFIWRSSLM